MHESSSISHRVFHSIPYKVVGASNYSRRCIACNLCILTVHIHNVLYTHSRCVRIAYVLPPSIHAA